ncbi:MAG: alpha-2-macroglobulin family protein [Paludibacteraceae bacterium]
MKRIYFFISLTIIVLGFTVTVISAQQSKKNTTQTMQLRWKKVEKFAQDQMPESALKEIDAILNQAQREKNSPQIIKAMIYRIRFITDKNSDEAIPLLTEFEAYANKSDNPTEKAVLHTMVASLYNDYYQNNRWTIDQRTDLQGTIPDDINEWTNNIFARKVIEQLELAMSNPKILQETNSNTYEAIIELGKDSRAMQPTLFDFLAYKKIELLKNFANTDGKIHTGGMFLIEADDVSNETADKPNDASIQRQIVQTYNQIVDFQKLKNNKPAVVYAELQKLNFEKPIKDDEFLKELEKLEKQYDGNEAVVEILAEKAEYYLQKNDDNPDDEDTDKNRKTAYEITQSGIKQYPNYKRIGLLKNIRYTILQKSIHSENNKITKPNSQLKISVKSANINQLKLVVYRVSATAREYQLYMMNERRNYQKLLYPKRTQVFTQTLLPPQTDNFDTVDTVFTIQTGDYGIYEYTVEESDNPKNESKTLGGFTVTDLAFVQRQGGGTFYKLSANDESDNANGELYIVDRMSGKPLEDVVVNTYVQKWTGNEYRLNFQNKATASADGKYETLSDRSSRNQIVFFERGKDKFFSSNTHFYWYGDVSKGKTEMQVSLFTDRSIYRPGQTLYYKGIAYLSSKTEQEVVKGKNITLNLYNANGENIGSQKLTTNDFGSIAGSFVLPDKGLNGAYRLQAGKQSVEFYVEEYKRPTFEVSIEKSKEEVRFGEEVSMKGNVKAYSGYNMNDAEVKYRVVRRPHRFCWWYSEPDKIITTGTTKSDSEGNFGVKFTPIKDKKAPTYSPWRGINNDSFYTYHIYADVTDSKGETQHGEQSVSVGDKSLFILTNIPEKIDKNENLRLDVTTQTLNGETVQSTVEYRIVKLENKDDYYENADEETLWKENGVVLSGKSETKDKPELDLRKLTSGMYKIILTTKDNRGSKVQAEDRFILFDRKDKKPPVKMYQWVTTDNTELSVGEKATVNLGTSSENTFVLYELMQGKTVLESRWVEFSNEIKTFEIPFLQSYGAGVTAQFTFVKDEQFFTKQVVISRKVVEKRLSPSVSVFRDKLKPGENAEWTIHIPESAKDKKTAELLIGMYDASLDELRPHSWSFNPTYREWVQSTPIWVVRGVGESDGDYKAISAGEYVNVAEFQFDDFNWFGLNIGSSNIYSGKNIRIRGVASLGGVQESAMDVMAVAEESVSEMEIDQASFASKKEEGGETEIVEKPKIRTNFNETAFFYPQLRTDEHGNVKVTFTAPESLTRWNVKMLAHTRDLYFGQNEMQAVTQKELMVQMNLPRFVRKSDKLVLVANVTNLSEEIVSPEVRLEVEKQVQPVKKGINIAPKQTVAFEWELEPFTDTDLAVVKITAQTCKFSDGEQKYLPVLPDKVLFTESQTMTMRAGQMRTFTFDNFIRNMKNVDTENFTVEYAGNPTWYAVQALPSIAKIEGENAIDYLTGYYANTLGSYIANANPKLAATFDRWKNTGGTRDALLSNLEKNRELKNVLLEETPWVMSAKDETEQKRQIGLLFDLNQTRNNAKTYMDKLMQLQAPSGGFRWFENMPENRYITQEILLNLARLNKMTASDKTISESANAYSSQVEKALHYLDLQIAKDFVELRKWNKNYLKQQTIGNLQLFYLHMRSEYPQVAIEKSAEEALKYYTTQSEKYRTSWTLYGKAMMAIVAHRNGKKAIAEQILTSIRENAMKTDELGMYWNANTAGWWWYERPIATQTAVMEAFGEIRDAGTDIDEMKIWLLKQKQTQRWDTPISTLDAIYALLNYGTDWLAYDGEAVIKLGSTALKPSAVEAGTAYIKETIPTEKLTPETGKITIENKKASGISWGAAYWQYYQDVDKVQSQGKEMKISKSLFVERINNQGKSMLPIGQTQLKKGDKVITRLVVTTDRDMEFVLLKDLRASCFEPVNQISGAYWKEGTVYHQTTKDSSTQFFFNYLQKGTYVFEYELWANNAGTFSSGIASIQCHYAPEFVCHSGGEKISVKP